MFRGTVLAIECSPLGLKGAFLDWVIKMKIDSLVEGELAGTHFAFRVHSPSRAGLEVGTTCTVHARWVGNGYRVDENQWNGAPG